MYPDRTSTRGTRTSEEGEATMFVIFKETTTGHFDFDSGFEGYPLLRQSGQKIGRTKWRRAATILAPEGSHLVPSSHPHCANRFLEVPGLGQINATKAIGFAEKSEHGFQFSDRKE